MPIKTRTRLAALLPAVLLFGLPCCTGRRARRIRRQVRVTTSVGEFVVEVRSDRAPVTSANFLRYVREGFYNNTLFHRVVASFVIRAAGTMRPP
jgi:hypothetical protein